MSGHEKLIPKSYQSKEIIAESPHELGEILRCAVSITIQPCDLLIDGAWYLIAEHWGELQGRLNQIPGETEVIVYYIPKPK